MRMGIEARRMLTEEETSVLADLAREHGLWPVDAEPILLARGTENTTVAIGDWIVRRGRDPETVMREILLLRALAEATTVPVPDPLLHDARLGLFAYRRLPGTPLIHHAHRRSPTVERAMIEVLSALRELDPSIQLPVNRYSPEQWHRDALDQLERIRPHLDAEEVHAVAAFLDRPPPQNREETTPQHDDLGAEHILVDADGEISGVIDWSDAARADPSHDIGSIHRDLGPDTARRVSTALGIPTTEDEIARIRFHARCRWIEDMSYGLQDPASRGAYLHNAQLTFEHTFQHRDQAAL